MDVLDRIVRTKREEAARLERWASALRRQAEEASAARGFRAALEDPADRVGLIAEVKRRSPSAGEIRPDLTAAGVGSVYEHAGANAVSVLTDGGYFGGSLDDLRAVRAAVSLPVLRKDFVISAVQVYEARAAGADAVLLIVRILDDAELGDLVALAGELGMDALVEAHDGDELERALAAGAQVVGINNRDLSTFETDLSVALGLASEVPPDRVLVAESGIRSAEDVDRLGAAGVDAVLVGESLMRADDIGAAAGELTGRPRRARAGAKGAAP